MDEPVFDWERFRAEHNLLEAAQSGLQLHLIPSWVRQGGDRSFAERVESSAYGETPPDLLEKLLDILAPRPGELFVDLGCGAGNVCAAVLARGIRVLGIERNPELAKAARAYLGAAPADRWEFREADFLDTDWSHANLAYATTTRFPDSLLETLAERLERAPHLRAIAGLGRPFPLGWTRRDLGEHLVRWNPGGDYRWEHLYLHCRERL